ncbi:trehalose-6-phosphate synthase [Salinirubellus sp. GCM10025818]|uniref:alpha,alpha-trehalose-phosphate synthase (UDP-forming) n=1 Tax=Salinirubellus TaxID=2162630 RepID=UPI0030D0837C
MAKSTTDPDGGTVTDGQHEHDSEALPIDDDSDVIVVSNRQPYRHQWSDDEITVDRPTGGLTAALDDVVQRIDGSWVAWGDGEADSEMVDDDDTVEVPPDASDDDRYPLERIWLTEEQVDDYYYGFSNQVLWPVCHGALTRVKSEGRYWDAYQEVNGRFADTIADRATSGDVVWLQDYHFALVPWLLQSRIPDDVVVTHFWHIPWPGWDTFRACPHAEDVLRGLLGNDLLGFHTERYRQNFLDCVELGLPEAAVDRATGEVHYADGVTRVEAFPLGVDTDEIRRSATDEGADERWARLRSRYDIGQDVRVGVGVDRLDYTKGIPQRLDAIEQLFEDYPEWRGEFTFVQVGSRSRSRIPAYREIQDDVVDTVNRINTRFRTDDWQPIVYTTDRLSNEALYSLYRNVDLAVVSPIRDGMNLVAQEFVAAQTEGEGVLVLSDQTGAHDLLGEAAVSITPQDTDGFAESIDRALTMPTKERRERMGALAYECRRTDVSNWIDDVLGSAADVRERGSGGA